MSTENGEQITLPEANLAPSNPLPADESVVSDDGDVQPQCHCGVEDMIYGKIIVNDDGSKRVEGPVCEHKAHKFPDGSLGSYMTIQKVVEVANQRRAAKLSRKAREQDERGRRERVESERKEREAAKAKAVAEAKPVTFRLTESPEEARRRRAELDREQAERARKEFEHAVASFASGEVALRPVTHDPKLAFFCRYDECGRKFNDEAGVLLVRDPETRMNLILPLCSFHKKAAWEAGARIRDKGGRTFYRTFNCPDDAQRFLEEGPKVHKDRRGGGGGGGKGGEGNGNGGGEGTSSSRPPERDKALEHGPTEAERARGDEEARKASERAREENARVAAEIREHASDPDFVPENQSRLGHHIPGLKEIMDANARIDAAAAAKKKGKKGGKKQEGGDKPNNKKGGRHSEE